MTTWAARLSNSTNKQNRSDVEETNLTALVKESNTITENGGSGAKLCNNKQCEENKINKLRMESPSPAVLLSSPRRVTVSQAKKSAQDSKEEDASASLCATTTRALSEQFRLLALAHNANCVAVPVLQLPVDCWQVIASFISYTDLTQLSSVCVRLFRSVYSHDKIWECQLRYFRSDMRNLRNGSLLLTRFALPPFNSQPIPVLKRQSIQQKNSLYVNTSSDNNNNNNIVEMNGKESVEKRSSKSKMLRTSSRCKHHNRQMSKSYERLKWERQLYMMDSQREWYFSDFTSLDDVETGVFTIPMQLSKEETLKSLLGANYTNGTSSVPINSPPMGHPFEVEHHTLLNVRIFKLKRPIICDEVGTSHNNNKNSDNNSNTTYKMHHYYFNLLDSDNHIMDEAYGSMPLPSFDSSRSTSSSSSLSLSSSSSSLLTSSLSRLSSASSLHTPHYYSNSNSNANKSVRTQTLPSQRYTDNNNAVSRAYWELQGCEEEDEDAALERVLALSRAEAEEETTPIHTQHEHNTENKNSITTKNSSNTPHCTFHCRRDTPLSISPEDERYTRREEEYEEENENNVVGSSSLHHSPLLHATETHETEVANIKQHKEEESRENWNGAKEHLQPLTCRDIITVIELLNANLPELSMFEVKDMTSEEDDTFMQALRETLTKALRRRLHLGNHHRGLRNNGQTSRHRTRQLRRHHTDVQNANRNVNNPNDNSNNNIMSNEITRVRQTVQETRGDESLLSLSPMEERMQNETSTITTTTNSTQYSNSNNGVSTVQSAFTNGQLPPVNRMLRSFTGVLLELTRHEAHKMCRVLADGANVRDKLRHFEDVNSYQLHSVPRIKRMLIPLPHTHSLIRYFVVPELCVDGKIGLLLVDAVRVLFIVEKEITATLDLIDFVV